MTSRENSCCSCSRRRLVLGVDMRKLDELGASSLGILGTEAETCHGRGRVSCAQYPGLRRQNRPRMRRTDACASSSSAWLPPRGLEGAEFNFSIFSCSGSPHHLPTTLPSTCRGTGSSSSRPEEQSHLHHTCHFRTHWSSVHQF